MSLNFSLNVLKAGKKTEKEGKLLFNKKLKEIK